MKVWVIAQNSFLETIRDRVLRVILVVCFLVILCSRILSEISLEEKLRVISSFSLGAIDLFGVILCSFIGATVLHKEIEKKTLYTILSRPVYRWQFLVGKYLGIMTTLGLAILLMAVFFFGFFWLSGGVITATFIGTVFLLFLGLAVLQAIAIFLATISSATVSSIVTIIIFLAGRSTYHLKSMDIVTQDPWGQKLALFFYYLLPNFNNFNIKLEAVNHLPVPSAVYLYALVYAFVYIALVLFLASLLFQQRNF